MMEQEHICPYCGEEIKREDILFWEKVKRQYTDNVRGNFLQRHGVEVPPGNKFDRLYYRLREDCIVREDENGWPTMIEDHLGNAVTPEDLSEGKSTDREDSFDSDFDTDSFDHDGESAAERKDRELHKIPNRACPHCHCELPRQFGTLKNHHVSMFGGRASGKTAYLINLFQQANMQLSQNNLGSVELSAESQAFLQPKIEYYERTGTIPPTPADDGLLPIVCVYKNREAEAFVTIYDIAGEGTGNAAYMANHKGITNCESLILMIDPNMFVGGSFYAEWTANHLAGDNRYSEIGDCCKEPLDSFLNQAGELCRDYADNIKNIVAVVTKMDMLLESNEKSFSSGDIEIVTDVKEKHRDAVSIQILKKVDSEISLFIEKQFKIQLRERLKNTFGQDVRVNILGVSTSTRVRGDGNQIRFEPRSSAMDSKHRIIEPFLVVLMYFGMVPVRRPDGSIAVNRNVVEEPETQQEPAPVQKPKRWGIFGRRKG